MTLTQVSFAAVGAMPIGGWIAHLIDKRLNTPEREARREKRQEQRGLEEARRRRERTRRWIEEG